MRLLPGRARCETAAAEERPRSSGSAGSSSRANRALGGELPGNFRQPRGTGRRRDRAPGRPRTGRRAPLRGGHSLGTRARLRAERGPRQRACGAASISAAASRRSPTPISGTPAPAISAAGAPTARCGSSIGSIRTWPLRRRHRPDGDHRLPGPAARCRERRQSLAGGVQRDRATNADRAADDDRARERRRGSRPSDPAGRGRPSDSGRGPGHRRQGRGRAVPGVDHRDRLSRSPSPLCHPHARERDPR